MEKTKIFVNWDELESLVNSLAFKIINSEIEFKYIFGLQRGGLIPAVMLSHKLGIPMTRNENSPNVLIVDDICDSGETFTEFYSHYPNSKFACLHYKPHTSNFIPNFIAVSFPFDHWIVYPWEREDSKTIQDYKI